MNSLAINIVQSNQYIRNFPDDYVYSELQSLKDRCVNNWLCNGKRNIKEFAGWMGVTPKQLARWAHNG